MKPIGAARIALVIAILFLCVGGCTRGQAKKTINVSGSSTVFAVAQAAAEEFNEENPDIKVVVQGGGSSAGIEAAITGASDIGTSSRDLKDEEKDEGLVDTVVAIDAVAIIVNPNNPVKGFSREQARGIFSGKITNWKEVGGRDAPIVLVNRDEASGTREAFKKQVMGNTAFNKEAVIQPGSGQVRSIVGSTPTAIGYMSLGYVTSEVKVVLYQGIKPSKATVKDGTYKLQRNLYFVTKGEPKGEVKQFLDYVLSPAVQKDIVNVEFVPVK